MLSIMPSINGNYNKIKENLKNGSIILINNTKELPNIIDYIKNKGYKIDTLSNVIKE
jgi:peptidoglycan/xylan/chitin deacetylase (PgdA/CDA1 family)